MGRWEQESCREASEVVLDPGGIKLVLLYGAHWASEEFFIVDEAVSKAENSQNG